VQLVGQYPITKGSFVLTTELDAGSEVSKQCKQGWTE